MPKPAGDGPGRKDAPGASAAGSASDAMQALFGENFRLARIKAGLTQHDIEMHTGIKQAYISQIEGGKQNPTLATMTALALAVGKDVRALLKPPASQVKRK
jgi:transcriptional regulator with XRE-family HTH domain